MIPFDGCTLRSAEHLDDRADQYFKAASATALGIEEVEGHKFLVFQHRLYSDTASWTAFVGFAGPNLLLVATDIGYLRDVLSRIAGRRVSGAGDFGGAGAMSIPAHDSGGCASFDRSGRDRDPSSPFRDPSKGLEGPWTDEQAIGVTFSFDPATGKGKTRP